MFDLIHIIQPPIIIGEAITLAGVIWAIVKFVVLVAISIMLAPDEPEQMGPPSLDSVRFPTAEEGRPHPVLFGTKRLRGSNITWWGNVRTTAVTS